MKRKMFSSCEKCNACCLYCFAKWDDYTPQESLTTESMKGIELIYPSCDSEFLNNKKNIVGIEKLIEHATKDIKILNISTKFFINENMLKELKKLNDKLISCKNGFIKIGVSFSNAYQICTIEKGTCNLDKRIENLQLLSKYNLPRIAIIKPILPFINIEEYKRIIDITKNYVDIYLIGDLYVKINTDFFQNYIKGKYTTYKRTVNWLNNKPKWDVVEVSAMKEEIKKYIIQNGRKVYESDVDCIHYYSDKLLGK